MNDHEYYSQKPLPTPGQPTSYQGGNASYYNQNYGQGQQPMPSSYSANSQSPFDTVFDDHVYPASSNQTGASSSRQHLTSQHYQETAYPGPVRVPSEEDMAYNHPTDDIPLEDRGGGRNNNHDPELQDHVYDAPQPEQKKPRRGRVSMGQLGMFGSSAKRIPFVVYFFTTVQVAVFIAELVKNGMIKLARTTLYTGITDRETICVFFRRGHRITHHDQAFVQPLHRSFQLHTH